MLCVFLLQECIKPVERPKITPQPSGSKIRIEIEDDGTYSQIKEGIREPLQKVQVTLSDCLACSGCITSAESVLISQQSPDELFRLLELNKTTNDTKAIVSVGVQAVLSISNKYNLSCQEGAERLAGLFSELGADYTTVITVAEDLSLIESYNEFHEAFKNGNVPIMAGVCPGWICYSEKLHQHALPKISKVKSPQQIMGSLIKLIYGKKNDISPDQIYHISLMSCFDRKLEASRTDFFLEEYKAKEVDVVITPIEIEQIFSTMSKTLEKFERIPLVDLFSKGELGTPVPNYQIMSHIGSGSGGYAEFIMRRVAKSLGQKLEEIEWKVGRNPDITEAALIDSDGKPIKFSIATGFRNIQTLVRKLKAKTTMPHYVEIMACPTGCLNGGAQVRPANVEATQSRELSSKLEQEYRNLPTVQDTSAAETIYETIQNDPQLFSHVLYTEFHPVEKTNLGMKW
ncbi:unnamed protein product [Orchesella dallaii]|uniref:Iron hydrogenase large subunit C-terminal domain-containing protein n=1 Tax=Orchesella dallaii TaxID=48710 RepID=A0ABP1QX02_9HEXA